MTPGAVTTADGAGQAIRGGLRLSQTLGGTEARDALLDKEGVMM